MIELEKVNGDRFVLNAIMVEQIASLPDTSTITLTSGKQIVVKTKAEEIVNRITKYYQLIGLVGTEQRRVME